MPIPDRDKIRPIARILQYAPAAVSFFVALSSWRKGFIEGAIIFGLMGIGLLSLVFLLHSFK